MKSGQRRGMCCVMPQRIAVAVVNMVVNDGVVLMVEGMAENFE